MVIKNSERLFNFGDLYPGDVFRLSSDYFMKIESFEIGNDNEMNCINFDTNKVCCVDQFEQVGLIDCELIVK